MPTAIGIISAGFNTSHFGLGAKNRPESFRDSILPRPELQKKQFRPPPYLDKCYSEAAELLGTSGEVKSEIPTLEFGESLD